MKPFEKKDKIQKEAIEAWKKHGYWNILAMCTGSGKTRVGILACQMAVSHNPDANILIVTPTEKLRDVGWKEEFKKWKATRIYTKNVDTVCYASLSKIEKATYSLVIMDEVHNLTEPKLAFFFDNKNIIKSVMGLTATPPQDEDKVDIFNDLKLSIAYKYTLEQGVNDGVVAPFNITVIKVPLDRKDHYIKKSSKSKEMVTETIKYANYAHVIRMLQYSSKPQDKQTLKFMYMNRMRLIYNFKSKLVAAQKILKKYFVGERSIIFSASIKQAEALCKNSYHSQTNDDAFNKFVKKKLNKLSAVKKLNEGENIPDLDSILVVQLTSKDKDIIQRIGRAVRWRPNHEAKVWILVSEGTQDEKWCDKALADFDPNRITTIDYKDLKQ